MIRPANRIQLAKTSAQIERELDGDGAIGADITLVFSADGNRWKFDTEQPAARANLDLQLGDLVILIAMADNGALGQGPAYIAEIAELDFDMSTAWLVAR
jgi:hypothetical protein